VYLLDRDCAGKQSDTRTSQECDEKENRLNPMTQQYISGSEQVERWFVTTLAVWAGCAFFAASTGAISRQNIVGPLAILATAIPIAIYFLNDRFRAYVNSIDLKHLTIFHLWRLLAGFTFVAYGQRHLLPSTFVQNAGYGDILVGLLVPVVLLLPGGAGKYLVFHTIGLLDFFLAVGTGIVLTAAGTPRMSNITAYPLVLIPLLGVPVSGAMHVMALNIAWKQLRKEHCTVTSAIAGS